MAEEVAQVTLRCDASILRGLFHTQLKPRPMATSGSMVRGQRTFVSNRHRFFGENRSKRLYRSGVQDTSTGGSGFLRCCWGTSFVFTMSFA